MKNALIINAGYTDNIGDQLIFEMLKCCLEETYNVDFASIIPIYKQQTVYSVLSNSEHHESPSKLKETLKKHIIKIISFEKYIQLRVRKYIKKVMKNRKDNYDLIILGGGELLKSNHMFLQCIYEWTSFCIRKYSGRIGLFGVSADTSFSNHEIEFLKSVLKKMDFINVRDKCSKNVIESIWGVQVTYSPDCVFLYKDIYNIEIKKNNKIWVSIMDYASIPDKSRWNSVDDYYEYWYKLIVQETEGDLKKVILGYTNADDALCTEAFYQKYKNKLFAGPDISENYDREKIIYEIASSSKIITGRMHAMILAKQFDTKVIPFVFKNKIDVFCKEWLTSEVDLVEARKLIRKQISLQLL